MIRSAIQEGAGRAIALPKPDNYSVAQTFYAAPQVTETPTFLTLTPIDNSGQFTAAWSAFDGYDAAKSYLLVEQLNVIPTFTPTNTVSYTTGAYSGGYVYSVGSNLSYTTDTHEPGEPYFYSLWTRDPSGMYSPVPMNGSAITR